MMLSFLILCLTLVASSKARHVTRIFTSLLLEPATSPQDESSALNLKARFDWSLEPGSLVPGDTFLVEMPCVDRYPGGSSVKLQSDGVILATCDFQLGDHTKLHVPKVFCTASNLIKPDTHAHGKMEFEVVFGAGSSATPSDLARSKCFMPGTNEVGWFDGQYLLKSWVFVPQQSSERMHSTYDGYYHFSDNQPSIALQFLENRCPFGYVKGDFTIKHSNLIDCSSLSIKAHKYDNAKEALSPDAPVTSEVIYCTDKIARISYSLIREGFHPILEVLAREGAMLSPLRTFVCKPPPGVKIVRGSQTVGTESIMSSRTIRSSRGTPSMSTIIAQYTTLITAMLADGKTTQLPAVVSFGAMHDGTFTTLTSIVPTAANSVSSPSVRSAPATRSMRPLGRGEYRKPVINNDLIHDAVGEPKSDTSLRAVPAAFTLRRAQGILQLGHPRGAAREQDPVFTTPKVMNRGLGRKNELAGAESSLSDIDAPNPVKSKDHAIPAQAIGIYRSVNRGRQLPVGTTTIYDYSTSSTRVSDATPIKLPPIALMTKVKVARVGTQNDGGLRSIDSTKRPLVEASTPLVRNEGSPVLPKGEKTSGPRVPKSKIIDDAPFDILRAPIGNYPSSVDPLTFDAHPKLARVEPSKSENDLKPITSLGKFVTKTVPFHSATSIASDTNTEILAPAIKKIKATVTESLDPALKTDGRLGGAKSLNKPSLVDTKLDNLNVVLSSSLRERESSGSDNINRKSGSPTSQVFTTSDDSKTIVVPIPTNSKGTNRVSKSEPPRILESDPRDSSIDFDAPDYPNSDFPERIGISAGNPLKADIPGDHEQKTIVVPAITPKQISVALAPKMKNSEPSIPLPRNNPSASIDTRIGRPGSPELLHSTGDNPLELRVGLKTSEISRDLITPDISHMHKTTSTYDHKDPKLGKYPFSLQTPEGKIGEPILFPTMGTVSAGRQLHEGSQKVPPNRSTKVPLQGTVRVETGSDDPTRQPRLLVNAGTPQKDSKIPPFLPSNPVDLPKKSLDIPGSTERTMVDGKPISTIRTASTPAVVGNKTSKIPSADQPKINSPKTANSSDRHEQETTEIPPPRETGVIIGSTRRDASQNLTINGASKSQSLTGLRQDAGRIENPTLGFSSTSSPRLPRSSGTPGLTNVVLQHTMPSITPVSSSITNAVGNFSLAVSSKSIPYSTEKMSVGSMDPVKSFTSESVRNYEPLSANGFQRGQRLMNLKSHASMPDATDWNSVTLVSITTNSAGRLVTSSNVLKSDSLLFEKTSLERVASTKSRLEYSTLDSTLLAHHNTLPVHVSSRVITGMAVSCSQCATLRGGEPTATPGGYHSSFIKCEHCGSKAHQHSDHVQDGGLSNLGAHSDAITFSSPQYEHPVSESQGDDNLVLDHKEHLLDGDGDLYGGSQRVEAPVDESTTEASILTPAQNGNTLAEPGPERFNTKSHSVPISTLNRSHLQSDSASVARPSIEKYTGAGPHIRARLEMCFGWIFVLFLLYL